MTQSRLLVSRLLVLCLAVGLWLLLDHPVQAATITVTTTADSGAGSLRQALSTAGSGDTITFDTALSGATISITSGPLALNKPLTIDGSALATALTIDGNGQKQLFPVSSSGVITLTHLLLRQGKSDYGGAIYNGGTLTLDSVTIADSSGLGGGALYNVGTVRVKNSTFSGNSAFSGGAIENYGSATLWNSTLSGNHANNTGGGLYNAGTLAFYNTILANSSSGGDCHNANDAFFGLYGVITANVRNLAEDGSCSTVLSGDPKLAPLAWVDGAFVHVPAVDSPAFHAGDNATCLTLDQRKAPRTQGAGCDLGAVEVETRLNTGSAVQVNLATVFSATPQPCATAAAPGLLRHTITPTLQSNAGSTYRDLYFVVTTLRYTTPQGDNIPILCNADGAAQGVTGVGARLTIAQLADLADNRWTPGENFAQDFLVGLPIRSRYRLFVDLYGATTTAVAASPHGDQLLGTLRWEFDENGNLVESSGRLFLPLVIK